MANASGIVDDPNATKDGSGSVRRIIPESRRADGSIRKERKVKPGFTPVEDIARFVPSRVRQARAEAAAANSNKRNSDETSKASLGSRSIQNSYKSSNTSPIRNPKLQNSTRSEISPKKSVDVSQITKSSLSDTTSSAKSQVEEIPESWDDDGGSNNDKNEAKVDIEGNSEDKESKPDNTLDSITKDLKTMGIQDPQSKKSL